MGDSAPPAKLSQTIEASPLATTIEVLPKKPLADGLTDPTVLTLRASELATGLANAGLGAVPAELKTSGNGPTLGAPQLRIGRYLVLRVLGEGGMGVVYAGYDEELDRKVAIKLLHPAQQDDSQLRARILREAQSLARVSAPNVVHVYEVGEFGGQLYIIMEFVNGTTLTKWQAETSRNWKDILRMYCAAGQGLLDAHEAGLVHRDFKPDNVLLGKDGRPRVADFGLARLQNPAGGAAANALSSRYQTVRSQEDSNPMHTPLTQLGVVMGTPLYMAPEQHVGEPADSRSDQFSFCVALYAALYHQHPFAGNTVEQLAVNTLKGRVLPRPASSHVPVLVHEALLRGLDKTPDQRFPSMRELIAALAFDPTRDSTTAPRVRRWVAFSVLSFLGLSTLGLLLLRLLGVSALLAALTGTIALCVFQMLVLLRFRRVLMTNAFHRGVMTTGAVFAGQLLILHTVGILFGLPLSQTVTIDLVAVLTMTCMMAPLFLPKLWPQIPISVLAIVVAVAYPEYATAIATVGVPAALSAAIFTWSYTVKVRNQTKRSKPAPPAP